MPSQRLIGLLAFFLFCAPLFASDYASISENIRKLTKEGQIKKAYKLSAGYVKKSDLIAMQYAQIALLVGDEEKGRKLFGRLAKSKQLSDLQKENMDRFVSQFDLSLKKRLKKAEYYVEQGRCAEADVLYKNLLKYQSTRLSARDSINRCVAAPKRGIGDISLKGRAYYKLGYDSNVSLDNEDLLSNKEDVVSDQYQKVYGSLRTDANTKQRLWFQGLASLYHHDYIADDTQDYDQLSLKIGVTMGGSLDYAREIGESWSWRIPVFFRKIYLDDNEYTTYSGLKGRIEYRKRKFSQNMELGYQNKSYLQQDDKYRNGSINDFSYGWRYGFGLNRIFGRIQLRDLSGPDDKSDAYSRMSLQIGWNRRLPSYSVLVGFKPTLRMSYLGSDTNYDGVDQGLVDAYGDAYNRVRHDLKHKVSTELRLVKSDWQFNAAFHHQQRNSNLPIYKYTRNTTELGIQYRF